MPTGGYTEADGSVEVSSCEEKLRYPIVQLQIQRIQFLVQSRISLVPLFDRDLWRNQPKYDQRECRRSDKLEERRCLDAISKRIGNISTLRYVRAARPNAMDLHHEDTFENPRRQIPEGRTTASETETFY
jgi:hypothetical protein